MHSNMLRKILVSTFSFWLLFPSTHFGASSKKTLPEKLMQHNQSCLSLFNLIKNPLSDTEVVGEVVHFDDLFIIGPHGRTSKPTHSFLNPYRPYKWPKALKPQFDLSNIDRINSIEQKIAHDYWQYISPLIDKAPDQNLLAEKITSLLSKYWHKILLNKKNSKLVSEELIKETLNLIHTNEFSKENLESAISRTLLLLFVPEAFDPIEKKNLSDLDLIIVLLQRSGRPSLKLSALKAINHNPSQLPGLSTAQSIYDLSNIITGEVVQLADLFITEAIFKGWIFQYPEIKDQNDLQSMIEIISIFNQLNQNSQRSNRTTDLIRYMVMRLQEINSPILNDFGGSPDNLQLYLFQAI